MKTLTPILLATSLLSAATANVSTHPDPAPARAVICGDENVPITVAYGEPTVIVMPEGEYVYKVFPGEGDWDFGQCTDEDGRTCQQAQAQRTRYQPIRPGKRGIQTVFTLVGNGKTSCTFVAKEASIAGSGQYDTRILIGGTHAKTPFEDLKWVPASEVAGYKQQADNAKKDADEQIKKADVDLGRKLDDWKAKYLKSIAFDYLYDEAKARKLGILQIWHDEHRTYIEAPTLHSFSVYEIVDGKPSVINTSLESGRYTIDRILLSGYMTNGTKKEDKLEFHSTAGPNGGRQ